jgi:hypothetical protein
MSKIVLGKDITTHPGDLRRFREIYRGEHPAIAPDDMAAHREIAWYRSYPELWGAIGATRQWCARHPYAAFLLLALAYGSIVFWGIR